VAADALTSAQHYTGTRFSRFARQARKLWPPDVRRLRLGARDPWRSI